MPRQLLKYILDTLYRENIKWCMEHSVGNIIFIHIAKPHISIIHIRKQQTCVDKLHFQWNILYGTFCMKSVLIIFWNQPNPIYM